MTGCIGSQDDFVVNYPYESQFNGPLDTIDEMKCILKEIYDDATSKNSLIRYDIKDYFPKRNNTSLRVFDDTFDDTLGFANILHNYKMTIT